MRCVTSGDTSASRASEDRDSRTLVWFEGLERVFKLFDCMF